MKNPERFSFEPMCQKGKQIRSNVVKQRKMIVDWEELRKVLEKNKKENFRSVGKESVKKWYQPKLKETRTKKTRHKKLMRIITFF